MASAIRDGGAALSLYSGVVTAAGTAISGTVTGIGGASLLHTQVKFTYGSGGTTVVAYVQTSLDSSATWMDVASVSLATTSATRVISLASVPGTAFITPTDGSLTANTMVPGVVGDRLRVKIVSTGTYAGNTTLAVTAVVKS